MGRSSRFGTLALAAALALSAFACRHAAPGYRSLAEVDYGLPGERTVWGRRSQLSIRLATLEAASASEDLPLVLLHPWGFDMSIWAQVAPELARSRRVLLLDLPAHGKSDKRSTRFSMERVAAAVLDAMDAAEVRRAVLVGNSLGGASALAVAQHAPARVAGLVLVAAPGGRPFPAPLLSLARRVARPHALVSLSDGAWDAGLWVASLGEGEHADHLRDGFARRRSAADWPAWTRATLLLLREVMTFAPPLEALYVPALVIHGERDPLIARAQSEALAARLPQAELVELSGCGHLPQVECAPAFLRTVAPFLDRVPSPGTARESATAAP
jgi:pimeloyl-ACP methyl ester carboxylesterase